MNNTANSPNELLINVVSIFLPKLIYLQFFFTSDPNRTVIDYEINFLMCSTHKL